VIDTFRYINDYFFGGDIDRLILRDEIEIRLGTKKKLSKTAGICQKFNNKKYGIFISKIVFNKIFTKEEKKIKIGGVFCTNKLECLFHVVAHEMIHLINMIECPYEVASKRGHSEIFQKMVKNIFGHTNCHHCLISGDYDELVKKSDEIKKKWAPQLKIGKHLRAEYKSKVFEGEIVAIGDKRVKIRIADKQLYVPYAMITGIY